MLDIALSLAFFLAGFFITLFLIMTLSRAVRDLKEAHEALQAYYLSLKKVVDYFREYERDLRDLHREYTDISTPTTAPGTASTPCRCGEHTGGGRCGLCDEHTETEVHHA